MSSPEDIPLAAVNEEGQRDKDYFKKDCYRLHHVKYYTRHEIKMLLFLVCSMAK